MKKHCNGGLRAKTLAKRFACGLTAAALLLGVAGCGKGGKDPEPQLTGRERVKAELAKALNTLDRTAPAPVDSSVDMTLSLELGDGSYNGVDLNDYLRDSSVGLKVDVQKDRLGLAGDVVVMGERFISGTAIYDDGILGFQVPELDSAYYTIDLNALLSQSYEGRQYLDALERMEGMGRVDIPTERIMPVLERYIDVVADTVTKDNTTTEKTSFSFEKLDGRENSGKVYVFTPTARDVEDLLTRLADQVEDDRELTELVEGYTDWASDIVDLSGQEKAELRQEMVQGLQDFARELRDGAADVGEEVEDAGLQCALYTAKNGAWKAELTLSPDGEEYRICAEGGDTGFALWAEDGRSTPFELVFQYEKTGGEYAGALTCSIGSSYSYETFTVELAFEHVTDKTSGLGLNYGSYTLNIPNLGRVYLDVTKAGSGTDHVLSLDIPALSQRCRLGGMPDFTTAKLTLHTTDKKATVSAPGGPTRSLDLMNMDYTEMEELFGPWEQKWESLLQDLVGRLSSRH